MKEIIWIKFFSILIYFNSHRLNVRQFIIKKANSFIASSVSRPLDSISISGKRNPLKKIVLNVKVVIKVTFN